mgnify:CR=1 FL=1
MVVGAGSIGDLGQRFVDAGAVDGVAGRGVGAVVDGGEDDILAVVDVGRGDGACGVAHLFLNAATKGVVLEAEGAHHLAAEGQRGLTQTIFAVPGVFPEFAPIRREVAVALIAANVVGVVKLAPFEHPGK